MAETNGLLLPYSGDDRERVNGVGQAYVLPRHGVDHSGAVSYAFNALGYRGPEFEPRAPRRVFAFGESHAFGVGIGDQESWPWQLARLWADSEGLGADDVAVVNFADPGASNDAIARNLISQCSRVPPDLVLVNFAACDRTEAFADGTLFQVGRWLLDRDADRQVRSLPRSSPLRNNLVERVRRGEHYFEAYSEPLGLLNLLRNILLVQYFAKARGIRALITCNDFPKLRASAAAHRVLEPLLDQVDDWVVCGFAMGAHRVDGDMAADGKHLGPRTHAAFARALLDYLQSGARWNKQRRSAQESPTMKASTACEIGGRVVEFYNDMPFNLHGSVRGALRGIRRNPLPASYPDLHAVLDSGAVRTVAEFGCGAGWLSNAVALHYPVQVTAVDFSTTALASAAELAAAAGTRDRVELIEENLVHVQLEPPRDLVVSLGVLHHTDDARSAFAHVQQFVAPGGYFYLGLYHLYGRRPFLELFRRLLVQRGEDAAFAAFRALDGVRQKDATHARSWFRDQVLHPHETQHTLEEVIDWLAVAGLELRSTSINRFAPIADTAALFAEERRYEARSRQANEVEGRYLPGFFTVLAQRPAQSGGL